MTFIETTRESDATGQLGEIYAADREKSGYVPNYTQAMSLRPDVIEAWRGLLGSIRQHMSLRRYELVTLAAAAALEGSY